MMKRVNHSMISKSNGRGFLFPLCLCVSVFQLLVLVSCVKDDLYDTPHPDHAKIAVTADWNNRGESVNIPASWNIAIGDYAGTETGAAHTPDYLFTPGSYRLTAYNDAADIAVSGTTATVAPASGNWDGMGSFVSNAPGWFFTSVQEVALLKDKDYELTVTMRQQVRRLTLTIEPIGDAAVGSIEGCLSGVAGAMDFATDTYGTESNIELHFTKIAEGADAGKWTATVQLLGITGDTQHLYATITYAGGSPKPTVLVSDMTSALAGFNSGKTVPLTLGGTVVETPTEAGITAIIEDWQQADGGNTDAH